jgi:hypothetical protein
MLVVSQMVFFVMVSSGYSLLYVVLEQLKHHSKSVYQVRLREADRAGRDVPLLASPPDRQDSRRSAPMRQRAR